MAKSAQRKAEEEFIEAGMEAWERDGLAERMATRMALTRVQERDSYPVELDGNCDHCGLFTRRRIACRCGAKTCDRCAAIGGGCKCCWNKPQETPVPELNPLLCAAIESAADPAFRAFLERLDDGQGGIKPFMESIDPRIPVGVRMLAVVPDIPEDLTPERSKLPHSGG